MRIMDMFNKYDKSSVNTDTNLGNRMLKINSLKEEMKESESLLGDNIAKDDLGKIVEDLKSRGIKPSSSEIEEIREYVKNSSENIENKKDVVKLAYDKDIDVTEKNLGKIEEALKGSVTEANSTDTAVSNGKEVSLESVEKLEIPEEIKERIIGIMKEHNVTFEQAIKIDMVINSAQMSFDSGIDELAEIYKGFIKKPLSLLQLLSNKNMSIDEMFNLDGEEKEKVEVKKINMLIEKLSISFESELSVKSEIDIESLEVQLEDLINDINNESEKLDVISDVFEVFTNEDFLMSMISVDSKNIMITEITEKIAKVTDQFNDFRKNFLKDLREIQINMETKLQSKSSISDSLSKQIENLDKLILKSEVNLYLDMSSEKKLLLMSKDLYDAKNYLDRGNLSKAKEIVSSVEKVISNMNFKPSNKKIVHNMNREMLIKGGKYLDSKNYLKNISKLDSDNSSPRLLLEKLRTLGLNNGFEVDEHINSKRQQEEKYDKNFKNLLLENKNDSKLSTEKITSVLKTLNNISGQQMINKGTLPGENQTMMFNIPVDVMNQQRDMKVYINSKKENQKLDWENFSMYLAIDLPVFGETGIKISAINRDMRITIKNDRDDIELIKDTLLNSFKKDLKDVGYNIVSVNMDHLTEKEGEKLLSPIDRNVMIADNSYQNQKGFDLRL